MPGCLWAAGLAHQSDPNFAWADLAPREPGDGKDARLLMARSTGGTWVNGARPEDVAPPSISRAAFDRLIAGSSQAGVDLAPLQEFLRLPSIVQLLAGRSTSPDGRATIVLLGLDAVPAPILDATFGGAELHDIVRREGITCITAYRGTPPTKLLDQFDAAFRLDAPAGHDWVGTVVEAVRGSFPPELGRARLLREQWDTLRLSSALFALWTASGPAPRRPR